MPQAVPVRRAAPGADAGVPGTLPEAVLPPAQPQGCKGRSPLHKKTKISPFPAGEGGRGDGAKRFNRRQGEPATQGADTPTVTGSAGQTGNAGGIAPGARFLFVKSKQTVYL